MSTMMKEALNSTDIKIIEKAFHTEKGQVTRKVDRILKILEVDESGSFDHESTSKIELEESEECVKESFRIVVDLHWYLSFRKFSVEGIDAAREEDIEVELNRLILPVENKLFEGLRSIEK